MSVMKKRTILLSVKNPTDYNLLADLLQKEGHRVKKLTGTDRMELVKKADAVLVDEMTGPKVCSFLKEIKESAGPYLPILALLPLKAPAEPWLSKCFDDIIRMPVGKAEFQSRINSFLKLRAQSEEIIENSERKYGAVFKATGTATIIIDEDTTIVLANNECEEVTGYSPDRLIGKRWTEFVHKEDLALMLSRHKACRENPNSVERKYEVRLINAKGEIRNAILFVAMIPGTKQSVVSMLDITERKKAETALRENEERFKQIFQFSPDAILLHDFDMNILDANKHAVEVFGYSRDKLLGKKVTDLHTEDELIYSKQVLSAMKKTDMLTVETKFKRKDGSVFFAEATPCQYALGNKQIIHVTIRDITERKQTEKVLKESEAKFRLLFSEMREGVYLHEIVYNKKAKAIDYRIIETNPASEKYLNIKPEYAIGKLATVLYGTKEAPFLDIYANVAETGKSVTFEEYFPPMKKYFHISVYCPEKGKFATIFTDITQRKRSEERLKQSEYLLRQVLNTNPSVIFVKDKDSRILLANKVMANFYNLSVEDVTGQRQSDLHRRFGVDPKQIQNWLANDKEVIKTAQPKHLIELGTDSQDRQIWFRTGKYPINIGKGRRGVLVISENITEQKQAEEQIKKDLKEKEVLLRELYHRTKNNMQVISAMLRLRARTMPDETVQTAFREIELKIRSMALVHQKLYESQDLSSLNLKSYFSSLISMIRQSFLSEGDKIQFHFYAPEDMPVLIDTAVPLGLILNELLTNAVKHAFSAEKKGEIQVVLKRDAQKRMIIEVSDNGAGFPEGFDVEKDGHLGLQMVIDLARHQLGGEVTFVSEKGSKCRIEIAKEIYKMRI